MKPETLIAVGVGAFVFWMHTRVKSIEEALGGGIQMVKLGGAFDVPEEEPDSESNFGFRPTRR